MKSMRLLNAVLLGVSAFWLVQATAQAQTRPYNPMRRGMPSTDAQLEEFSKAPRTLPPETQGTKVRPVAVASNNQWRSIRQPSRPRPPAPPAAAAEPMGDPMGDVVGESPVPPMEPGSEVESIMAPPPGQEFAEGPWDDGSAYHGEGCCDGGCQQCCQDGCGGCDFCSTGCGGPLGLIGCWWPRELSGFAGVHGFKGPVDQGRNGNFGFHYGLNLSGFIKPACGIAYQIGGQFAHSNFSGDNVAFPETDDRGQVFYTAGLFRRVMCGSGLQGGVVFDALHDEYYAEMELSQLRGELSFVGPCHREVGFWFAASLEDDTETVLNAVEVWESTDQYAFFYRRTFEQGANFRVWAGFSGRADGIIGAETQLPLSDSFALQTNFNYLLPEEGGSTNGFSEEGWALGINLVWYPGCGARCLHPARPLFNVADNATFMVDRLR